MRVLLTGGGTMGSVSPLLALIDELKKNSFKFEFFWIGTKDGPEKKVIDGYNIPFQSIAYGKLRRYLSLKNFIDPFLIILGFFQSLMIILKLKPRAIVSAGSFVSVPVVWAGWLLDVPALIHQQDLRPGLANRLMSFFAKKITVVFEESLKSFPKRKTVLTGNLIREDILKGNKERAIHLFSLERNLPVLLVLGGGSGALNLNQSMEEILPELTKFCQVIHIAGKGKGARVFNARHHLYEFLTDDYKEALAVADLVISRAGMGALTELAFLGKPVILASLPKTHQEDNASYFLKRNSVVVLNQERLKNDLVNLVKDLFNHPLELERLKKNIAQVMVPGAARKIREELLEIMK